VHQGAGHAHATNIRGRDGQADILRRGIAEGTFRTDLDVETDAAILMQTVLGALRLRQLGAELNNTPIEDAQLYAFCLRGLHA